MNSNIGRFGTSYLVIIGLPMITIGILIGFVVGGILVPFIDGFSFSWKKVNKWINPQDSAAASQQ